MIELLTANTPNGKKISIMLEEIKYEYKVTKVNILKGAQFEPKFRSLSPFSKIPVIIDHDNKLSIFESGAILIYLGEKSGKTDREADTIACIRTVIVIAYMVTNVAIVANAIRHWDNVKTVPLVNHAIDDCAILTK